MHATLQEFHGDSLEPPQCRLKLAVYAERRPGHGRTEPLAWIGSAALQSPGTTCNECRRNVHDPWECSSVEITHRAYADVVVVAPAGRLDHTVAEAFERSLMPLLDPAAGGGAGLVLDFSRVDYISSVGLRALMIAGKAARARGARIAVAGLRPVVQEIFAISRFNGVVEMFPTVAAALAAISLAAATAYDGAAKAPEP